jgi:DNA-binding FadR family transcriptional regulator
MRHEQLRRVRAYFEKSGFREHDRLPPERVLAEELGLTRGRIRGCLKVLADEGLIWRHVGKGTFFGPRPVSVNGRHYDLSLSDLTNPREVLEARLALEPVLARMATERAKARDFDAMSECLARMADAADRPTWMLWDRRFHRAIARAAGNTLMLALFDTIQANRQKEIWGKLDAILNRARIKELGGQHQAIYQALRKRDADRVAKLMQGHISAVRSRIFSKAA